MKTKSVLKIASLSLAMLLIVGVTGAQAQSCCGLDWLAAPFVAAGAVAAGAVAVSAAIVTAPIAALSCNSCGVAVCNPCGVAYTPNCDRC